MTILRIKFRHPGFEVFWRKVLFWAGSNFALCYLNECKFKWGKLRDARFSKI